MVGGIKQLKCRRATAGRAFELISEPEASEEIAKPARHGGKPEAIKWFSPLSGQNELRLVFQLMTDAP